MKLIVEIRQSYNHLVSTVGFTTPVRWHLYFELGPRWHKFSSCPGNGLVMNWQQAIMSSYDKIRKTFQSSKSFNVTQDGLVIPVKAIYFQIGGLEQDNSNCIAHTLELQQSCSKPSMTWNHNPVSFPCRCHTKKGIPLWCSPARASEKAPTISVMSMSTRPQVSYTCNVCELNHYWLHPFQTSD